MSELLKVCFVGSSSQEQAQKYQKELYQLGRDIGGCLIAHLVCGGYFATAQHVIEGAKSVNPSMEMSAYFNTKMQIASWGESIENNFYEKIGFADSNLHWTEAAEDERASIMINNCDVVIAFTGGKGTKLEIFRAIEMRKRILYFPTVELESLLNTQELSRIEPYRKNKDGISVAQLIRMK
jgi:predicted Rossmann-fold nucleotide-binding protein